MGCNVCQKRVWIETRIMKECIIWCDDGETYIACYTSPTVFTEGKINVFETREISGMVWQKKVMTINNISYIDWKLFKIRVLKWKPVQDVEEN